MEAQGADPVNDEVRSAIRHWPHVAPLLTPPRSKAAYRRLVAALDAVLDAGGADESHPLAGLAGFLGELVSRYEAEQIPIREMPARAFLRELMKQHRLTQKDLPEIGAQSVVSAVLSGKRRLNVRQIARLSKRFNVPADAFMS
jgi:HTH-type transcriptional regulator/antitoxin HigA